MTTKLKTYGIMIIAAVLLMTLVFAGAASADITINNLNDWQTNLAGKDVTNDVILNTDIDLSGVTNPMIKSLTGTFDGQNHTVSNFVIDNSSDNNIGLIGSYSGTHIKDLTLSNFSVSGSGNVGGLVGYANDEIHIENVHVMYGNVSGSNRVGGLVGFAYGASWINESRSERMYISGSYYVGGLVGGAYDASHINASWVNVSEIAGSSSVGGLVGYANAASYFDNALAMDCKIGESGSCYVGGLVGYADDASEYDASRVENCTIAGSAYVGGLVGNANVASKFTGGKSYVNATWVGGSSNVGALLGDGIGSKTPAADTNPLVNNVWGESSSATSSLYGNDFSEGGKTLSDAKSAGYCSIIDKDSLTAGVDYGYGSAPKYTVNVDTGLPHGSLSATPSSGTAGTAITVTATNVDSGYHLNRTYHYNPLSPGVKTTINGGSFGLPAYNVNVGGDFLANETNLTFYNETEDATFYQTLDVKYATSVPSLTFAMPEKSGYVFAGWKTVNDNIVLFNATGSPKNATAYYITESGIWDYKGANGTTLKLVGVWGSDKTVITLNRTGGDGADQQVNVTNGAASTDPQADTPTKTGFTFNGWYNETGGLGTMVINAEGHLVSDVTNYTAGGKWTNTSSAITLYANWTETNTDVSFATNGGSVTVDAKTFEYGQDLSSTTVGYTGSLAGYHFGGWNSSLLTSVQVFNDTGKVVNNTAYVTADRKWNYSETALQLNAFWIENVTKLEFKNSSVLVCATTVTYKQQVVPPVFTAPTRVGYTLKGWNVSDTSVMLFNATGVPQKGISPYIDGDGNWKYDGAEENIVLNAVWEKSSTVITLQKTGEWETANTVTVQNGTSALLPSMPANPVRDGYTFNGWKNESGAEGVNIIGTNSALVSGVDGYTDGSGNWINSSATVTLYGNWSANVTNLEFFNTTDDSSYFCATTVTYDIPVGSVNVPAKDGYTFKGWNYNTFKLFNETGVAITSVTDYITNGNWSKVGADGTTLKLYGDWAAKEILINLNAEGGVADTTAVNVTFNTSTLSKDIIRPTKTGFTFNGWYNETGCLGEMIINETGKLVNTVAGYTDGGKWINATSPITLYANWTSSVTNVTFNPGAGSTGSTTKLDIPYGKVVSIAVPSEGTKAGYHFGGWNTSTDHAQLFNETGAAVNSTEPYITNDGKWNSTESYLTLEGIWYQNVTRLNLTYNGVSKVVTATFEEKNLKNNDITAPTKTGYEFKGWFTAETGGSQILRQADEDLVKLVTNKVDGYVDTNGQWANSSVANGEEIKLYAQWTPATTEIKLLKENDEVRNVPVATYNSSTLGGDPVPKLISDQPGHTFHGWYNKSSGGIMVINGTTRKLVEDASGYTTGLNWTNLSKTVYLYENFTVNVTTLNFTNNTGASPDTWESSVAYGSATPSFTAIPSKAYYTFSGWNLTGTTTQLWNNNGEPIKGNDYIDTAGVWRNASLNDGDVLYLEAYWVNNTTAITLNANGGSPNSLVTATYGESSIVPLPITPARAGYWFDGGWSNESDGSGDIIITNDTKAFALDISGYTTAGKWTNDTRAVTLYANWTANVTKVTFNPNGGTDSMAPTTFTYNESLLDYPYSGYKLGYHFEGWTYSAEDIDPKLLFNASGVNQSVPGYIEDGKWVKSWENGKQIELKAKWAANVTYLNLSKDGASYGNVTATYLSNELQNNSVAEPTKPGYWFEGWFNQSEGGVRVLDQSVSVVILAANVPGYTDTNRYWINNSVANGSTIDLFAQWTPAETELELHKFDTNATTGTLTAHYGSTNITGTKQTPVLAGYVFHGWNNGSKSTGTPVLNISSELLANAGIYTDGSRIWQYAEPTLLLFENFTANVTNVSFNPLGGSAVPNEYFTYNEPVPNVNVSYRPGYWFTSWNLSYDESWLQLFDRNATPIITNANYAYINELGNWSNTNLEDGAEITMDAQWTANKTTIILNATPYTTNVNPTSVVATFNETTGWNITNPTYTGYDFHGWYNKTNGEGERIIYVNGTLVPGIYNYTNDDGEWNNTVVADGDSIMFYAYWTANITQLNLSKNDDLGTTTDAIPTLVKATYDSNVTVPNLTANPTKVGYTFMGWYDAPTAGIKVMENISNPLTFVHNDTIYTNAAGYWKYPGENMSVVNLSAHWLANETVLVLNKNNNTETYNATPNNVTVTYDSSEVRPDTIEQANKTGYILLGWFNQSEGGVMVLDNSSEPQLVNASGYVEGGVWKKATTFGYPIELYAHWTPITYTVKFDANGGQGSMADMHFTYDEAPRALTANDFQRYNSNFMYWIANNTGIRYNNTEFVRNLTTERDGIVIMTAQWQGYSTGSNNEATILNNTTVKKNTYTSSSSVSTYTPSSQSSFVSSTQTQTSTPAVTSVATPVATQAPVAIPTAPTTAATTKPTQKSPAPVVGLIAGLGAAALFLRLRK